MAGEQVALERRGRFRRLLIDERHRAGDDVGRENDLVRTSRCLDLAHGVLEQLTRRRRVPQLADGCAQAAPRPPSGTTKRNFAHNSDQTLSGAGMAIPAAVNASRSRSTRADGASSDSANDKDAGPPLCRIRPGPAILAKILAMPGSTDERPTTLAT